jgi:hypothetical protein
VCRYGHADADAYTDTNTVTESRSILSNVHAAGVQ